MATQRQVARRPARQGPRCAVLLPRGSLRRVCGAQEGGRRPDGDQRRARAVRPRRRPDPPPPGQAAIRFGRSHLRRMTRGLPFAAPKGATVTKRLAGALAAISATWMTLALVAPTPL